MSDSAGLLRERKRPRKLSHKVMECTVEEVSAGSSKKKVHLKNSPEYKNMLQLGIPILVSGIGPMPF